MVFIYVLELTNKKYYIGKTLNPDFRISSHFNSNGSQWTKKYKPIRLYELIPNCDNYDEDKYTRKYMDKFGIDNVRGGSYIQIKLDKTTIDNLHIMNKTVTDACYICGNIGHFARACKKKNVDKDNYIKEECWICEYCDKKFNNIAKCQNHETICKKNNKIVCYRCNREGHKSPDCLCKNKY